MAKIVTAEEAVKCVQDNNVIAVNGVCAVASPDLLCVALGNRYKETQSPKALTMWGATALGISLRGAFTDAMFKDCPGLFRKAVMGQYSSMPSLSQMVSENEVSGFNLPQGIISHLYRAAAGKKPVIISRIGLKTSVDPRMNGACLNEKAQKEPPVSKVVNMDGKEYLEYYTPKINVCFICGTAADQNGNISFEDEAAIIDATAIAMATKANGGTVCVQVERITDGQLHPKMVKIPGKVVDYIVVNPKQMQCVFEKNNPAISGDEFMPTEKIVPYINKVINFIPGNKKRYDQYAIARRAYKEIKKGDVINLGVGIPGIISTLAIESGQSGDFVMTNEVGLIGGIPLPRPAFGASINAEMITDMATMFDFYDGGHLDGVYVGAAQVGPNGDVGVSKVGKTIIGVGGFINLTQSTRKTVFMTSFMDGKDMDIRFEDGKLCIREDGTTKKFVKVVEQISFSGDVAIEDNQDVIYITERCVFKLTPNGLLLTEIAPGIDLQSDVLDKMDFKPLIAENIKIMDKDCFDFVLE